MATCSRVFQVYTVWCGYVFNRKLTNESSSDSKAFVNIPLWPISSYPGDVSYKGIRQISSQKPVRASLRTPPASGIWGSEGKHIFKVFQRDCTILHSHHQRVKVLVAPYPPQHLALSIFETVTVLVSVYWYLILVSVCTSTLPEAN